jgi:hypothetical protein
MFLPRPVPEELAMPDGQLVQKLGLEPIVPILAKLNPGNGDVLSVPVVEYARVAGLSLIQQVVQQSFLTTARRNNGELYAKAQAELMSSHSVLLSSRVMASQRKQTSVELVVQTPEGIKYICAKKLLIAIPPRLETLQEFNPTQNERSIFIKWLNTGYYTSIVKHTGLSYTMINSINPQNAFGLPNQPGIQFVAPSGIPDVSLLYYVAPRGTAVYPLSDNEVKTRIIADLKRAQSVNRGAANVTQTQPEFVAYRSHAPFFLQASAADIQAGFYDHMNALQGQQSTFWTGAAWGAHDSSMLWDYNKQVVVPMLLKSL